MKICSKCKQEKPLDAFSKNSYRKDGLMYHCKACDNERNRAWGATEHGRQVQRDRKLKYKESGAARIAKERYRMNNPEKVNAHKSVGKAIRRGKIKKPLFCVKCGDVAPLEGHHSDYDNRWDVTWLCRKCHAEEHRLLRNLLESQNRPISDLTDTTASL